MRCRFCGHAQTDHDYTMRLCAGEAIDQFKRPAAAKCIKGCRQFIPMQYDTEEPA